MEPQKLETVGESQEREAEDQHSYMSTTCDAEQDALNSCGSTICDAEQDIPISHGSTTCDAEKDGHNATRGTTCAAEQNGQNSSESTTCDAVDEQQILSGSPTCDAEEREEEYRIPEQQEIFFVPCGNHNSPRRKRRKLAHEWSQASTQKFVSDDVKPLQTPTCINHTSHNSRNDRVERLVISNKTNSSINSHNPETHVSELLEPPTAHPSALSILNEGAPSTLIDTGPWALTNLTASHEDTIFNKEFLDTILSLHRRYFSLDMKALLQIAVEVCNLCKLKSKSALAWLSKINRLVSQTTNFDSIRDPSCFGAAATTPAMLMKVATESSEVTLPCFLPKLPQFFFATLQFHLLEVGPSRLYCMDHARLPLQVLRAHPSQSPRPASLGEKEQLFTTICCLSAAGNSVPPFLLLPSKLDQLSSSPGFGLTTASFCDWLQFFVSRSGSSPQQPTVLIVRGCQRFLHSVAAQRFAHKAGLVLLSFPSHLPNVINPLPEFFLSLAAQFRIACVRWLASNPDSRQLEQTTVASLYALSFKLAATQSAVTACFRDAGLYPLVCLEKMPAFWKLVEQKKRAVQSLQAGKLLKEGQNTRENVSCSASEKVLKERLAHCNQQITGIAQNSSSPACRPHHTDHNLATNADLSDKAAESHPEQQSPSLGSQQQQPAVAVYRVRLPETSLRPRASVMSCSTGPVPGTIFSGPISAQLTVRQRMAPPVQSTGGQRMAPPVQLTGGQRMAPPAQSTDGHRLPPPLINSRDTNSNKMSVLTPRTDSSCSSSFTRTGISSQSSNSPSLVALNISITNEVTAVATNGTSKHDHLAKNAIQKPQRHFSVVEESPSNAVAQTNRGRMKVMRTHKSWDRGSIVLPGLVSDSSLTPPEVIRSPGPFQRRHAAGDNSPKSTSLGNIPLRNTARKRTRPTATANRFRPTRHLSTEVSCPVCLESTEEEWIQCMHCKAWVHELCADIRDPVFYYCDFCLLKHKERLVGGGGEGIRTVPPPPAPEPAKSLKASTLASISAAIEAAIRNTCEGVSRSSADTDHGDEVRRLGSKSPFGATDAPNTDSEDCAKTRPGIVSAFGETGNNSADADHSAEIRRGIVCPSGDTNTCSANSEGDSGKRLDDFNNSVIGDGLSLASSGANTATPSQVPFGSVNEDDNDMLNASDQSSTAATIDSVSPVTTTSASLAPTSPATTTTASLAPTSHVAPTTASSALASPTTTTTSLAPTCPATTTSASLTLTSPATTTTASLSPTSPATTTTASLAPTSPATTTTALLASTSPATTTTASLSSTSPATTTSASLALTSPDIISSLAPTSPAATITTASLALISPPSSTTPASLAPTSPATTSTAFLSLTSTTTTATASLAPASVHTTTNPLAPTCVPTTTGT